MSEENREHSISQEMKKIKAAVKDRVAKKLAGAMASMKEATQGVETSINVASGISQYR